MTGYDGARRRGRRPTTRPPQGCGRTDEAATSRPPRQTGLEAPLHGDGEIARRGMRRTRAESAKQYARGDRAELGHAAAVTGFRARASSGGRRADRLQDEQADPTGAQMISASTCKLIDVARRRRAVCTPARRGGAVLPPPRSCGSRRQVALAQRAAGPTSSTPQSVKARVDSAQTRRRCPSARSARRERRFRVDEYARLRRRHVRGRQRRRVVDPARRTAACRPPPQLDRRLADRVALAPANADTRDGGVGDPQPRRRARGAAEVDPHTPGELLTASRGGATGASRVSRVLGSVAERELRVLGHLVRGPRRA